MKNDFSSAPKRIVHENMKMNTRSMNVEAGAFVKRPTPENGSEGEKISEGTSSSHDLFTESQGVQIQDGEIQDGEEWKIAGVGRKNKKDLLEERTCIIWGMSESITLVEIRNYIIRGLNFGEDIVSIDRKGFLELRRIQIVLKSVTSCLFLISLFRKANNHHTSWRFQQGRGFRIRSLMRRLKGSRELNSSKLPTLNQFEILNENVEKGTRNLVMNDEGKSSEVENEDSQSQALPPLKKGNFNHLNIGTWNVEGINSKWELLENVLARRKVDVLGVTEHWLLGENVRNCKKTRAYTWIGNEGKFSEGAKRGSCGVGFLIKKDVAHM
eukprot:Awhi_evm1s13807